MSLTPLIEDIRSSSRLMVRELGFMNATLAATDYSPSAVHSLLEIGKQGAMTAAQLVQILGLEKSSVSRMLSRLLAAGELLEIPSRDDARSKRLTLTEKGIKTVNRLNEFGSMRVLNALHKLDPAQQQLVAQGLSTFAHALENGQGEGSTEWLNPVEIITGYLPGMIGRIAEMHGNYYAKNYGFGCIFEGKVATGIAEFAGRLNEDCNQIWLAVRNGRILGSVALDGQDLGNNDAHLRWFILDDSCRGTGMGRKLLNAAMSFSDQHAFSSVQLWTFSGLDAARRLYESFDFTLSKEWQGTQWGKTMTEQHFTRQINPSPQAD